MVKMAFPSIRQGLRLETHRVCDQTLTFPECNLLIYRARQ